MQIDIMTALIGVMTSIALAGIPWAYKINARLVSIETKLEVGVKNPKVETQIENLNASVSKLKDDVDKVKGMSHG